MPRTRRASIVPRTPGGMHLQLADISADTIDFDDEVSIKSSVFRGRTETPSSTATTPKMSVLKKSSLNLQKFVLRKSTDLKKLKNINDKIEAILSSPMVEVRRKPLGRSRSFASNDGKFLDQSRTPICVPSSKDLVAVSNRRLSAVLLSKFTPHADSISPLDSKRASICPGVLSRRRTNSKNTRTPIRCSLGTELTSTKDKNTPIITTANDSQTLGVEPMNSEDVADLENESPQRPFEDVEHELEVQHSQENVSAEPTSVSEFRVLAGMESSRLSSVKAAWEDVLTEESGSIPDIAVNSIHAAVGKCGLLLTKKFPFFLSLIDLAEASIQQRQLGNDKPQQSASVNDLLGMWAIISQQISEIDSAFDRLRRWREVSGWALEARPETPARYDEKAVTTAEKKQVGRPRQRKPMETVEVDAVTPTVSSKLKSARARKPLKFRAQLLAKKKAMETDEVTDEPFKTPLFDPDSSVLSRSEKRSKITSTPMNNVTPRRGRSSKTPLSPKIADENLVPVPETPITASVNVSAETGGAGDPFAVPASRPRRRTRRRTAGLSASQAAAVTPDPFSPPPRPATGTPRPRLSRDLLTTANLSLRQSVLMKKLMVTVTSGNSSFGATPPRAVGRKRKSVRFPAAAALSSTPNGHRGGSGSPRESLPVTPHTSVTVDPSRRISRSGRSRHASFGNSRSSEAPA
ncbi:unnamed protein product [Mesocestoides corti]|uniref:Guanylate kinase-associated protein mars n=1 Tax=Mesocestoides corti TaxID=53468 RepID=A0A0R3UHC3_MESCO|nr:unnamed protein product [Mesocestoides corti]